MSFNFYNKPFRGLSASSLFVMLLLWTGTEQSSGSGVTEILARRPFPFEAETQGQFSVITYNIAGLPEIISSAKTPRAPSTEIIGKKLESFDIVHVQEDFNYNRYLYQNDRAHSYRTVSKGKVPFGDGLNTLSKYPVTDIRRIKWNDCTGADCLTPKGFTYSRIQLASEVYVDFYNVHANAYNDLNAASARRQNIIQLSEYIKKHSSDNAVIVMGDLNGRYGYFFDNIKILSTQNGLQDTWLSHKRNGQVPQALKSLPPANILTLTDTCETIDKILYRGCKNIELKTIYYKFENQLFSTGEGLPLSDHHPVSAEFVWRAEPKEPKTLTL